jgi:hypothetical protein
MTIQGLEPRAPRLPDLAAANTALDRLLQDAAACGSA